ncbi:uncharacterized protein LOC131434062 [Malaya genurostris]|uniref:uncharacterized protein LOC131434062 n=1 Tax=Malaya genurostris TaxID=325434 RepID=UPI0026F3E846|nr:uncharacterized protein LOC131434062 [Malaya genurostris]
MANRNERLLDLILANDIALPVSTVTLPIVPLIDLDLDHPALAVEFKVPIPNEYDEPSISYSLDFRRADYTELNDMLSAVNWQFIETSTKINDAVEYFCDAVENVVSRTVPVSRPPKKPPWTNRRLRALKRTRSSALRKFCSFRSSYFKQQLKIATSRYRRYNMFLYRRYIRRTGLNLRRNPKLFWSFVNSKRRETGLPHSMFFGNQTACTEKEKCDLFAHHFKDAFHDNSATQIQIDEATAGVPRDIFNFHIPPITEQMVETAIRKLKLSFAAGPDGIPSSVLKRCAGALSYPISKLFNLSTLQSEFPSRWKFSYMFPVHKKGDKRDISNYRDITSLCACSKLFEIIVNDILFASSRTYIDNEQHGFYPKRSVTSNLMIFTSKCVLWMVNRCSVYGS